MGERIERIRRDRRERFVGDVAPFYLPYVEDAIRVDPHIRIVCLTSPCEDAVRDLCKWLDAVYPLRINHWSTKPGADGHHDPLTTRTFPQYEIQDRADAIRRYWAQYHETADELVCRYPRNVRVFNSDEALTTERGLRGLLAFAGIPEGQQIVRLDARADTAKEDAADRVELPAKPPPKRSGRATCVVLVPDSGRIVSDCEHGLRQLERCGYTVRRIPRYAAIDQGRNQMATDVLLEGFEETMWIDSDIGFDAGAVDRLRSHELPIVSGVYAQKGKRAIACQTMPGTSHLVFGKEGRLYEVLYVGAGFLHVRREVYSTIQQRLELPMCNEKFGRPMIPFFLPVTRRHEDGYWYLGEDYAFCQRARDCGYQIMADTTIRLWHYGSCGYGWEDSGIERDRYDTFTLHFAKEE